MANKENKDIVEDFVSKLKGYEMPYRAGAWEEFAKKTAPVKPVVKTNWKYWSAAAAVLLISSAAYLFWPSAEQPDSSIAYNSQSAPAAAQKQESSSDTASRPADEGRVSSDFDLFSQPEILAQLDDKASSKARNLSISAESSEMIDALAESVNSSRLRPMPAATDIPLEVDRSNQVEHDAGSTTATLTQSIAAKAEAKSFKKFAQEQEIISVVKKNNAAAVKKWELGAYVAPSRSAEQFNMGGGLSLSYQLSDRVSVRSGLSVQNYDGGLMKTAPNMGQRASNSVVEGSDMIVHSPLAAKGNVKELTGVSSQLVTIDIPVDIKYKFAGGLYATAGVAYSNIVSQNRQNHYINNIGTETFSQGFVADSKVANAAVAAKTSTETSREGLVENQNFGGFANFSLGKKMPVSKSFSLSVEPFVKVPIGSLRSTDMNYTNGGIRIVTSF